MRRSRPRFPHWRPHRPHYPTYHRAPHTGMNHQRQQQKADLIEVFDFLNLPDTFPTMKQSMDDPILTPIIMERNQQLIPSAAESFALMDFVTRVRQKLETLVLSPMSFTACQVSEVRDVGSHKHNTLINTNGTLTSDFVVVLKTLPTHEAIEQLGQRLKQDIENEKASESGEALTIQTNESGLKLKSCLMVVQLFITTLPAHWNSLDPTIHLSRAVCEQNFNAIKHAKWIDEVCIHPSNKVLVRLIKDLRQRFPGLKPLNPWLINLLAHYCVTNKQSNEQLPPSYALKRALQWLSSGLFLPGSKGLYDPIHYSNGNGRATTNMLPEEQDRLCCTSQTLLRALAIHPRYVLGLEAGPDIFAGTCQLNGVFFTPSVPVLHRTDGHDHSLMNP